MNLFLYTDLDVRLLQEKHSLFNIDFLEILPPLTGPAL